MEKVPEVMVQEVMNQKVMVPEVIVPEVMVSEVMAPEVMVPEVMAPKMLNSTNYPNPDITDFLTNGKKTLICSDFEGTMPLKQIEKFEEVFKSGEQILYLGDLFDNTGGCKKYENSNYCSLKTLKYLVEYPDNSRYTIGNRDINKLKLVPLLQFTNGKKWWISSYESTKMWKPKNLNNKSVKWKRNTNNKLEKPILLLYTEIVLNLINLELCVF